MAAIVTTAHAVANPFVFIEPPIPQGQATTGACRRLWGGRLAGHSPQAPGAARGGGGGGGGGGRDERERRHGRRAATTGHGAPAGAAVPAPRGAGADSGPRCG